MNTQIQTLQRLAGITESAVGQFKIIEIDLYTQSFKVAAVNAATPAAALAAYFNESDPDAFQGDGLNGGIETNPAGGWVYKGDEQLVLILQ